MTKKEHKQQHIKLHKSLDELAADFMVHTGKLCSQTTIMELIEWSHNQTKNPTEMKIQ